MMESQVVSTLSICRSCVTVPQYLGHIVLARILELVTAKEQGLELTSCVYTSEVRGKVRPSK